LSKVIKITTPLPLRGISLEKQNPSVHADAWPSPLKGRKFLIIYVELVK